ncbi:MAG TPA: hypothetical protein VN494_02120 [Patescibacteria group bacterium]|nr:hypothetical protein [Patescibacteria group bacterium]
MLSLLHKSEPVDEERRSLSTLQHTCEPFDIIRGGNHSHDRCHRMDQLTGKETERNEGLHQEYRRGRKTTIGEKAGTTIQQGKIFRFEPDVLTAKRKRMDEAAA